MPTYEERCINNDDDQLIANELHGDVELQEDQNEQPAQDNTGEEDENEAEKERQKEDEMIIEEEEYRTKDPVKKYHLNYDQSVAMSKMHP